MNWDPVLQTASTGLIAIMLGWLGRRLGVQTNEIKTERRINGRIGVLANEQPQATVAEVLDTVKEQMVNEKGMEPEDAKLAVAAAQVKNALPTGQDAHNTKIDDVWMGGREPVKLHPPEAVHHKPDYPAKKGK